MSHRTAASSILYAVRRESSQFEICYTPSIKLTAGVGFGYWGRG